MTYPLFLADLPDPLPAVGTRVELAGDEGRHAVVVRRLQVGEVVLLSDGRGRGVRGPVVQVRKAALEVEVVDHLSTPETAVHWVAAQALAKGDRGELAIEMMTELGVTEFLPWSSARSVVRWSGERGEKSLARWRATVREAAKQSRRLAVPTVRSVVSTRQLAAAVTAAELAIVLHEEAPESLATLAVPDSGTVLVVIGPEGGITTDELHALADAGARLARISDGVLRTSTAGVVALAGLMLR